MTKIGPFKLRCMPWHHDLMETISWPNQVHTKDLSQSAFPRIGMHQDGPYKRVRKPQVMRPVQTRKILYTYIIQTHASKHIMSLHVIFRNINMYLVCLLDSIHFDSKVSSSLVLAYPFLDIISNFIIKKVATLLNIINDYTNTSNKKQHINENKISQNPMSCRTDEAMSIIEK